MEKPASFQHQTHVLFEFTPLDGRDETDDKIQRSYVNWKQLIANKSPKECHKIYLKHISGAPQNIEEVTMGLLVAILAEQDGPQSRYYRDVATFSKDGLALFSSYLNVIIIERLSKLKEHSVKQVFWVANQLMKASITSAENVCSNLIRQTAGGDISAKNLRLTESLLDLLVENRSWVINSTSFMVPTIIYTFMRLIADHMGQAHSVLRQKEVDFVIGLIREKFSECLHVGRDFLRLLQNINKIPEFEKLWHDIYNNPKSLHPTFHNPLQILANRTPRRLFQSRLTFEMERKISFLATQVKFGNQKRYQDWFHKQYLATPESLSLRCDLIRYICTIIHPSNEVLCSDIIPRWAIIGWLLTTCTTSTSASNSKLALFFDWLLYDAKMDNIMNVEPAILVMYYSMRSHPSVTAGLLDFLCRIPSTFSPKLSEPIKSGIKKSLQQILEKRVIQSIAPLFDNPKHHPALKLLIKETFPEFCTNVSNIDNGISIPSAQIIPVPNVTHDHHKLPEVIVIDQDKTQASEMPTTNVEVVGSRLNDINHITNKCGDPFAQNDDKSEQSSSSSSRDKSKAFSWNGTDNANPSYSHKQNHDNKTRKASAANLASGPDSIKRCKQMNLDDIVPEISISDLKTPILTDDEDYVNNQNSEVQVTYPFMVLSDFDFKESLNNFEDPLRGILEDLNTESCKQTRCNLMDKLISVVFDNSEQSSNSVLIEELGHCVAFLVVNDFTTRIFPSSSQDTCDLEASIGSPFFVLCRSALFGSKSNCVSRPLALLVAISKFLEATGFLLLYFLRVNAVIHETSVVTSYLEFSKASKRKLSKCLYDDLFMASTYDSDMFCYLLPSVFGEIASSGSFLVTGNIDLIHLVVSTIDPRCLQELICLCLTGTAKVIKKEDVLSLIESSLGWESWEQYCLWKLISAQSVPIENYISLLPKLDAKSNAEAMSCIMLNLQKECPEKRVLFMQPQKGS